MEKEKYYVSLASGEISRIRFGNNDDFTIQATADEVRLLRAKLDNMHASEIGSFWRAHVPIKPYHNDQANDDYDREITEAFQMLFDLGNEETRTHITQMEILTDQHM